MGIFGQVYSTGRKMHYIKNIVYGGIFSIIMIALALIYSSFVIGLFSLVGILVIIVNLLNLGKK